MKDMGQRIQRALISVSNKNGVLELAKGLHQLGVEILSTGGTYKYLQENSLPVIEVASITNFPEILDGRVKTLHPQIHGAILAKRDDNEHMQQLQTHNITPIDLVCVNLYPFEATINQPNCTFINAIENIDIGGPAMLRAASKNHQHVAVITNPDSYNNILEQIKTTGNVNAVTRLELARSAFAHTSYYDSLISSYLSQQLPSAFPNELTIPAKLAQVLRYGENSHQDAAFYKDSGNITGLLASFEQIQGKELSYNNLADADTAWECVKQFMSPACVIVKHANPCGVAISNDALSSYNKAFSGDPISSFGGIIAFNVPVAADTAEAISKQFCEVLIAPAYTHEALAIFAKKPNVRVLTIAHGNGVNKFDYKRIGGGILVQTPESKILDLDKLNIVSKKSPDASILSDMEFAWSVARFIKSNAIVLVRNCQTIGIGAGQMSRIDSSKLAMTKAKEFGFDVAGCVAASDAFFPFRDNVDLLAGSGVAAIIQPGGSIKDSEVFAAADEHNVIMALTGYRTFRH